MEHGVQEIDSTVKAGHENRLTGPISSVASLGATAVAGRVELELRKEGCSSSLYS